MNSQIVSIKKAIKSESTFVFVTTLIPFCLFLRAGFVSISVIWFFTLCLFNFSASIKKQSSTNYAMVLPILFFMLNILWLFLSIDIKTANDIVLKEIHLLLIPIGFIVLRKKINNNNLRIFLWTFLITCLLTSLICYFSAAYNIIKFKSLFYNEASRNYPYFSSYLLTRVVNITPVYLSLFSNFCLLTVVVLPLIQGIKVRIAIAAYFAFFILMLGSKIGVVCLIVILLFRLISLTYKSRYIYIVTGCLGMIVIAFLYSNFASKDSLNKFLEFKYKESEEITFEFANRLTLWSMALETIEQSPIMGFGTGGGQQALEATYKRHNFLEGVRDSLNPHNQFLSTMLDFGLIGFCVLVLMLIIPLIQAIRLNNAYLCCFSIMIILFFCIESILVRQKGIVFFSFFYCLLICHLSNKRDSS